MSHQMLFVWTVEDGATSFVRNSNGFMVYAACRVSTAGRRDTQVMIATDRLSIIARAIQMKLCRRYKERKPIRLLKNSSGNVDRRARGNGRGGEIIIWEMARETGEPNRAAQVAGISVDIDRGIYGNGTPRFEVLMWLKSLLWGIYDSVMRPASTALRCTFSSLFS